MGGYYPEDSCLQRLEMCAINHDCLNLAEAVLRDPLFAICSGSSNAKKHHYGTGGLVQHTLEVVMLCASSVECLDREQPNFNSDSLFRRLLFLASLFHDIGKTFDYVQDLSTSEWHGHTDHKRRIHHISRSALIWEEAARKHRRAYEWLTDDAIEQVTHAILAHHGLREWGSPVSPDTQMAWILHQCDNLSARVHDCGRKNS